MIKKPLCFYACGACAMICIFIWYAVYRFESQHDLVIHFFDVGQGDGIFFELPNHVQVVIDGGPGSNMISKLGSAMPFWDRTIDLVMLTHPHADHVDGLIEVVKRYEVGMIIESGSSYPTPDYHVWHEVIKQKNIPVVYARKGQYITLSDRATLNIFYPKEEIMDKRFTNIHDGMVVTKLIFGSTTVLFTGDAERPIEYELLAGDMALDADILKVGHHGSKTSTTQGFLDAVHPRFAIISAGRNNHYGHPHQEVIDRIERSGINLLRTDINGDITLKSDGEKIWKSE